MNWLLWRCFPSKWSSRGCQLELTLKDFTMREKGTAGMDTNTDTPHKVWPFPGKLRRVDMPGRVPWPRGRSGERKGRVGSEAGKKGSRETMEGEREGTGRQPLPSLCNVPHTEIRAHFLNKSQCTRRHSPPFADLDEDLEGLMQSQVSN